MIEEFVGLLVGAFAVVARHLHADPGGDQPAFQHMDPVENFLGHGHRVRSGALGHGERHRRNPDDPALPVAGDCGNQVLLAVGGEAHLGHVADIDRPPVAGGQEEVADLVRRAQRFTGDQHHLAAFVAHEAGREGGIGAGDLAGKLLERHAIEREPLRIGRDPQPLAGLADDVGKAHIGDLGNLGP